MQAQTKLDFDYIASQFIKRSIEILNDKYFYYTSKKRKEQLNFMIGDHIVTQYIYPVSAVIKLKGLGEKCIEFKNIIGVWLGNMKEEPLVEGAIDSGLIIKNNGLGVDLDLDIEIELLNIIDETQDIDRDILKPLRESLINKLLEFANTFNPAMNKELLLNELKRAGAL